MLGPEKVETPPDAAIAGSDRVARPDTHVGENGLVFDDMVDHPIVNHPIMGREWAVQPILFQGVHVRKDKSLLLRRRNRT